MLLRRLQRDPELPGVGAVVLDEVHERQLIVDLTLALLVDVRANLRDDLTVVAMSATVEAERTALVLGGDTAAPVISVAGSLHPVAELWCPPPHGVKRSDDRGVTPAFLDHVAATTRRALAEQEGDVLVFLPGAAEVSGTVRRLAARPPTSVRCTAGSHPGSRTSPSPRVRGGASSSRPRSPSPPSRCPGSGPWSTPVLAAAADRPPARPRAGDDRRQPRRRGAAGGPGRPKRPARSTGCGPGRARHRRAPGPRDRDRRPDVVRARAGHRGARTARAGAAGPGRRRRRWPPPGPRWPPSERDRRRHRHRPRPLDRADRRPRLARALLDGAALVGRAAPPRSWR